MFPITSRCPFLKKIMKQSNKFTESPEINLTKN